jgi:hypothetical protein
MSDKSDPKPRFVLYQAINGEDAVSALTDPEAVNRVADLFVYNKMKAAKHSDAAIQPAAGEVVFDSQKGLIRVHDGKEVHTGKPCCTCPDCGGNMNLTKKFANMKTNVSPWFYKCDSYGCKAMAPARVNGSLIGEPVDAETRKARRLTNDQFDRLWLDSPEVLAAKDEAERKKTTTMAKQRAYRWLAYQMKQAGSAIGNVNQMDIPTLRVAYRLCRDADINNVVEFGVLYASDPAKYGSPAKEKKKSGK